MALSPAGALGTAGMGPVTGTVPNTSPALGDVFPNLLAVDFGRDAEFSPPLWNVQTAH